MTRIADLENLLSSEDVNSTIIELDNFIGELCEYGDDLDILNEHQRSFYFNQNLEREVNNGGFRQYFFNSSGKNAHETVNSLEQIGALITARLLQLAIKQFPKSHVPKDHEKRRIILEDLENQKSEVFDDLDQEFFRYQDDLNVLNIRFVREHKNSF